MAKTKTILITGAAGGFGRDTCLALAKRGHDVIATVRREESIDELERYVQDQGVNLYDIFKLDVTDKEDRSKLADIDNIDVLVNNAAVGESGSLMDIDIDKVRYNFEVNVFSQLELSQIAFKNMLKQGSGNIVFISSQAGRLPVPFLAPYSMTKFSLSGGIAALHKELNLVDSPVSACLVEPGAYNTGFNQKNLDKMFEWLDESHILHSKIDSIKKRTYSGFERLEVKKTDSIVKKIVKACEADDPKLRYAAPWWQYLGTQILRILGR